MTSPRQMLRRLALGLMTLPPAVTAACSRADLVELTNRYVAAQSLGESRYMTALTADTAYTENFNATDIATGILTTPLKIDFHRSIHDSSQCATFTELVVADPAHMYVIGTQMWLANPEADVEDGGVGMGGLALAEMNSIITDADDWLFNASHTLHYALREDWAPIPESERDERDVIQAAGDAYLDLFVDGPGSVEVPWHDECKRLEGGLYTAEGDTCNSGVPSGVSLVDRRYVVDEVMGVVDVFLRFGGGDEGSGLPDSHEFRVEGGKLRFIHTITACSEFNCGFGDPPEALQEDLGF